MKRCAYSHSYAELTVRGHHIARGELTAKHLTLFSRVAIRDKRSDCRRQRDYHVSTCPVPRGTRTYTKVEDFMPSDLHAQRQRKVGFGWIVSTPETIQKPALWEATRRSGGSRALEL